MLTDARKPRSAGASAGDYGHNDAFVHLQGDGGSSGGFREAEPPAALGCVLSGHGFSAQLISVSWPARSTKIRRIREGGSELTWFSCHCWMSAAHFSTGGHARRHRRHSQPGPNEGGHGRADHRCRPVHGAPRRGEPAGARAERGGGGCSADVVVIRGGSRHALNC